MRLIDADRLKQEIATIMPSRIEVNLVVDAQPDAVVRCKDCKYVAPDMECGHPNETLNPLSRNDGNPKWFCADGERRDGT